MKGSEGTLVLRMNYFLGGTEASSVPTVDFLPKTCPNNVQRSPGHLDGSLRHADGTCRTDEAAEVTAYALGTHEMGTALLVVEDDGLMTAVATRDGTATASHS